MEFKVNYYPIWYKFIVGGAGIIFAPFTFGMSLLFTISVFIYRGKVKIEGKHLSYSRPFKNTQHLDIGQIHRVEEKSIMFGKDVIVFGQGALRKVRIRRVKDADQLIRVIYDVQGE